MTQNHTNKNMALLKKKHGSLGKIFEGLPSSDIKLGTSKSGRPIFSKRLGDSNDWIQFHSKYDPEKEAKAQAAQLNFEKANLCVIFGFGLGYSVEEVLKSSSKNFKILVVEPDFEVFHTAMAARDLSQIIHRVDFFLGEDIKDFRSFCEKYFQLATIKNIEFLEHPPSFRFHSSFFENIKEIIRAHIVKSAENLITLMEEGGGYQQNTLLGIKEVIKNPGVSALFGQFKNIPAIIVSAGPSLDKNLYLLKRFTEKVVIIAVDTAVKPLLKHGITPHLVVTADPSFENYTHLHGCFKKGFYLVVEPMAYPLALKEFSKMFIASFDDRMMTYIQSHIGKKGKLKAWGSVSSMAFDLAEKMGASPVIFVGQDLAYSGGRNYCDNTEHDGVILSSGSTETRTISEQKDIFGFPVMVEQQHYSYANYLEKEFETAQNKVINATEGGILKNNIDVMSLKEALLFADGKVCVSEKLDKIYKKSSSKKHPTGSLLAGMKQVIRAMKRASRECDKGLRHVVEIEKKSQVSKFEIKKSLSQIQKVKDHISKEKDILPFINMGGQKMIFSFQRGLQVLDDRNVDHTFLLDAAKLYANLFRGTREVISELLPFFEKAYLDVQTVRTKKDTQ